MRGCHNRRVDRGRRDHQGLLPHRTGREDPSVQAQRWHSGQRLLVTVAQ
eukprot:COSAG02_NODE_57537_length_280_cov_0.784530_2_plen_48_part_01